MTTAVTAMPATPDDGNRTKRGERYTSSYANDAYALRRCYDNDCGDGDIKSIDDADSDADDAVVLPSCIRNQVQFRV